MASNSSTSPSGRPKRRASSGFHLSGISSDIKRRWCLVPSVTFHNTIYPRVHCFNFQRTYLTSAFVEELLGWPEDALPLNDALSDVWRVPEMIEISRRSRDGERLIQLGVFLPLDANEVSLLTLRGAALAFKAMEHYNPEAFEKALKAGVPAKLAALQEHAKTEKTPDPSFAEEEDGGYVSETIDLERLSLSVVDPEVSLPVLKRRRYAITRTLEKEINGLKSRLESAAKRAKLATDELTEMRTMLAVAPPPAYVVPPTLA